MGAEAALQGSWPRIDRATPPLFPASRSPDNVCRDTETDNYASYSFKNETLWCTAMVFGLYTE